MKKRKIFILDDELLIQRSLERAVQFLGHQSLSSSSAEEALKLWPPFNPDIGFVDILLPGMSGLEFLKNISGKTQAKIILISAHDDLKKEDIHSAGADRFFKKPFDDIFKLIEESLCLLQ